MNERSDDTTERDEGALPESDDAAVRDGKRRPGGYYYDDATGYQVYDPETEGDGGAGEDDDEHGGGA